MGAMGRLTQYAAKGNTRHQYATKPHIWGGFGLTETLSMHT
jgi:hypothetical protein